jgi:hypothetical protein
MKGGGVQTKQILIRSNAKKQMYVFDCSEAKEKDHNSLFWSVGGLPSPGQRTKHEMPKRISLTLADHAGTGLP